MSDALRKWYAPDAANSANVAISARNPQKTAASAIAAPGETLLRGAKTGTEKRRKTAIADDNSPFSPLATAGPRNFTGPEPAWLTIYKERRAIAEIDGGTSPAEAHRIAFWETVQAWEAANPLPEPQSGCCVACGLPVPSQVGCEVRDSNGRIYRAHDTCGQRLHLERRAKAVAALAAAGIRGLKCCTLGESS